MHRVRAHPDRPVAGMAFSKKGDVDSDRPQRRLRAPQATGKRARRARPIRPIDQDLLTLQLIRNMGGAPRAVEIAGCPASVATLRTIKKALLGGPRA
jgi:hypothetical protein